MSLRETLVCPHCGSAIDLILGANLEPSTGAIVAQNGNIARETLNLDLERTKDGRQTYNLGYPREFEAFWKLYPLKRDKRKALKAWRNAINRGAIFEINAGAIRYRNDANRAEEFTKYAEGWLNGDGWLDEPLPVRLGGKEPAPRTATEDDYRRISHD